MIPMGAVLNKIWIITDYATETNILKGFFLELLVECIVSLRALEKHLIVTLAGISLPRPWTNVRLKTWKKRRELKHSFLFQDPFCKKFGNVYNETYPKSENVRGTCSPKGHASFMLKPSSHRLFQLAITQSYFEWFTFSRNLEVSSTESFNWVYKQAQVRLAYRASAESQLGSVFCSCVDYFLCFCISVAD